MVSKALKDKSRPCPDATGIQVVYMVNEVDEDDDFMGSLQRKQTQNWKSGALYTNLILGCLFKAHTELAHGRIML